MKKTLVFAALASLFLSACNTPAQPVQTDPEETNEATETPEQIAREKAEAIKNESTEEKSETTELSTETGQAQYIAYSESTYKELLGKKPFAVFFHAPWCPVCVGMEKDINGNLSSLPTNSIILKADFDTEKELEKKYDITSQSTVVLIDSSGNYVKTLAAPDSEELKEELGKLS